MSHPHRIPAYTSTLQNQRITGRTLTNALILNSTITSSTLINCQVLTSTLSRTHLHATLLSHCALTQCDTHGTTTRCHILRSDIEASWLRNTVLRNCTATLTTHEHGGKIVASELDSCRLYGAIGVEDCAPNWVGIRREDVYMVRTPEFKFGTLLLWSGRNRPGRLRSTPTRDRRYEWMFRTRYPPERTNEHIEPRETTQADDDDRRMPPPNPVKMPFFEVPDLAVPTPVQQTTDSPGYGADWPARFIPQPPIAPPPQPIAPPPQPTAPQPQPTAPQPQPTVPQPQPTAPQHTFQHVPAQTSQTWYPAPQQPANATESSDSANTAHQPHPDYLHTHSQAALWQHPSHTDPPAIPITQPGQPQSFSEPGPAPQPETQLAPTTAESVPQTTEEQWAAYCHQEMLWQQNNESTSEFVPRSLFGLPPVSWFNTQQNQETLPPVSQSAMPSVSQSTAPSVGEKLSQLGLNPHSEVFVPSSSAEPASAGPSAQRPSVSPASPAGSSRSRVLEPAAKKTASRSSSRASA